MPPRNKKDSVLDQTTILVVQEGRAGGRVCGGLSCLRPGKGFPSAVTGAAAASCRALLTLVRRIS